MAAIAAGPHPGPTLDFSGLDVLWIQIAGTVCNIACRHCFITCGPKNTSHPMMETERVLAVLDEARQRGVKEVYFTGGEPFLHPDILPLIARTLRQAPLSILTNALLIDDAMARALARRASVSDYSLDLRVSLDGASAEENDPIRGKGTFTGILAGARALIRAGLMPVFTVTTVLARYAGHNGATHFIERLRALGIERPRVKLIPPFALGRQGRGAGAYPDDFRLGEGDLDPDEAWILQCGSCRAITARGVYPCPILIEAPGARMGPELADGLRSIRLEHPACATCHVEGFSCRT